MNLLQMLTFEKRVCPPVHVSTPRNKKAGAKRSGPKDNLIKDALQSGPRTTLHIAEVTGLDLEYTRRRLRTLEDQKKIVRIEKAKIGDAKLSTQWKWSA